MATRFIPVSICRVPATIDGKHFLEATDREVIAKINDVLRGHSEYLIQPLDVEQFVVDPAPVQAATEHLGEALQEFAQRGMNAQRAVADWAVAQHRERPKSPKQLARAKRRVTRMINKGKVARRRARR